MIPFDIALTLLGLVCMVLFPGFVHLVAHPEER